MRLAPLHAAAAAAAAYDYEHGPIPYSYGGAAAAGYGAAVGLYSCCMHSVYPQLESAWFQPLILSSEKLVSNLAFKCNSFLYTPWASWTCRATRRVTPAARSSSPPPPTPPRWGGVVVQGVTLNAVVVVDPRI
jgi:hypothetical protein